MQNNTILTKNENKRWDFCFAHLRWCHNGWASNILIVVDTGYTGIHHSKYWMPIHYDTIEDGLNKKKNLIFYSLNVIFDICLKEPH